MHIQYAHRITLSWGNRYVTASWEGWPSDGSPKVTRRADRSNEDNRGWCRENYIEWAITDFLLWINEYGRDVGLPSTLIAKNILVGQLASRVDVILLNTTYRDAGAA